MSGISDFPPELFYKVFKFLLSEELLILRRVCHRTKTLIDDFNIFNEEKWTGFQLVLKESADFKRYMESSLKIPNIKIEKYLDSNCIPILPKFLKTYGPFIKNIQVQSFFGCKKDEEFDFFNHFSNLEILHINELDLDEDKDIILPILAPIRIPQNFLNLKDLKVEKTKDGEITGAASKYFWDLLSFPQHTTIIRNKGNYDRITVGQLIDKFKQIVSKREVNNQSKDEAEITLIKIIDLNRMADGNYLILEDDEEDEMEQI